MDRILKFIDRNPNRSAVIASMLDWAAAIKKFMKMGIRPDLIPILVSYLTDREMQVRFNNQYSTVSQVVKHKSSKSTNK